MIQLQSVVFPSGLLFWVKTHANTSDANRIFVLRNALSAKTKQITNQTESGSENLEIIGASVLTLWSL